MKKYFVRYLGGYPVTQIPSRVILYIEKSNFIIEYLEGFGSKRICINRNDLIDVSTEEQFKRPAGKIAAGAIIGGVVSGGIGLIAGAAIGAKRKDLSKLFVLIEFKNKEFKLIFKTGKDTYELYEILTRFVLEDVNEVISPTEITISKPINEAGIVYCKCGSLKRSIVTNRNHTGNYVCMKCDFKIGFCPNCNEILRTQRSEQCRFCGASWRE